MYSKGKYTVFLWILQKLRAQINFIVTRIVLQTNTISAPHLLNWSMAPNFHCDSRGFRPDIIGTTMVKIPPIADLSVNCTQFQRVFHVILWRMHYLLLSLFKIWQFKTRKVASPKDKFQLLVNRKPSSVNYKMKNRYWRSQSWKHGRGSGFSDDEVFNLLD